MAKKKQNHIINTVKAREYNYTFYLNLCFNQTIRNKLGICECCLLKEVLDNA